MYGITAKQDFSHKLPGLTARVFCCEIQVAWRRIYAVFPWAFCGPVGSFLQATPLWARVDIDQSISNDFRAITGLYRQGLGFLLQFFVGFFLVFFGVLTVADMGCYCGFRR